MTPMLEEEYRQFGERAFARIPLVVAGAIDLPKVVDGAFQQSDIPGSIAHLLGVDYCRSPFNGLFLERVPQPAQYVVHARGDDRNRVDVYFGDRIASYLEDGDASSWATAAGRAARSTRSVSRVSASRSCRMNRAAAST